MSNTIISNKARNRQHYINTAGQYIELTSNADGKVPNIELAFNGRRFAVGTCRRGHEARQVFQGPMVPGPWAYTFELCTTIADARLARCPTIEVVEGDVIALDGYAYVLRGVRNHWLALDKINDDGSLTPGVVT